MKCHYISIDGERILIPMCESVVRTEDLKQCKCSRKLDNQNILAKLAVNIRRLERLITIK